MKTNIEHLNMRCLLCGAPATHRHQLRDPPLEINAPLCRECGARTYDTLIDAIIGGNQNGSLSAAQRNLSTPKFLRRESDCSGANR